MINIRRINLRRKVNLGMVRLFILLFYLFLSWLPGDVIGVEDELVIVIKGIELSESFLKNGRIELSSRLKIIDYDKKSDVVIGSYLMDQDFIWIFKDKKWRIEQQMKDSKGNEYYNIQVFDGEKKTDFNVDLKMATISDDTRYVNPPHTRAYGSPGQYMLDLFQGLVSEDLRKCQKIEFIGNEKLNDVDCHVIKVSDSDKEWAGLLWVAPSFGYRGIKSDLHGRGFQLVREVKNLREWSKGIWLPTEGSYTLNFIKEDGAVLPQVKVNFSVNHVELEREIHEDSFQLEFPPGTAVINQITNTFSRIPDPAQIPSEEELFKIAQEAKEGKYTKVPSSASTSPDSGKPLVSRTWPGWFVGVIILVPLCVIILLVSIFLKVRRRKTDLT